MQWSQFPFSSCLIILDIFHVLICLLCIFFNEMSIQVFCPFKNQVVYFIIKCIDFFLYFGYKFLSCMCFMSVFTQYVPCPIYHFIMDHDFCVRLSKKFLPDQRSQKVSPIFLSRNVIILDFTCISMIHFEPVFYIV